MSKHSPTRGRPRVKVLTKPMWRLRLTHAAPRRVLQTLAIVGVLAAVHLAGLIARGGGVRHADPGRTPARQIHTPTAKEPRR
jgi:hypothetical protein